MSRGRRAFWTVKLPTGWWFWWKIAYFTRFYKYWNKYKESIGIPHDHDVYRYWLSKLRMVGK